MPGDSFPDVSSGVLAQMQHLVAYSGERVAKPLAPRTREKQDDIIEQSLALRRPVRFADLTNRWAKDSNYAKSIEWVAERYRQANCTPGEPLTTRRSLRRSAAPTRPQGGRRCASRRPGWRLRRRATRSACDVYSASYGGSVALLIRSVAGASVNYTILQVEPEPGAAAGGRLHQDARAQRQDDRPLPFARAGVHARIRALSRAVLRTGVWPLPRIGCRVRHTGAAIALQS